MKSILGLPTDRDDKDGFNTNLGFVYDILRDFWIEMKISEDQIAKNTSIGFADDDIAQDDVVRSFYQHNNQDLMKSVHHLLTMVNLSTYTVNPPIQPLITNHLPLFESRLISPSDEFYDQGAKIPPSTIYPTITEERQHVASVISRIFESGLGSDTVKDYFEEELETTTLARKGRTELTAEFARDLVQNLVDQLKLAKSIIDLHGLPTKDERENYNAGLQNLIVAQGSLLTHLWIDDVKIPLDKLKL